MEQSPPEGFGSAKGPSMLVVFLVVLATACAVVGAAGCLVFLTASAQLEGGLTRMAIAVAAAWLVGGAAAGCALWALADMTRRNYETERHLGRLARTRDGLPETMLPPVRLPTAAGESGPCDEEARPAGPQSPLEQLARQVGELRADLMLTPEQLAIKRRRYQERRGRELVEAIVQAIEREEFDGADRALAALAEELPDHERLGALRQTLERQRARALAEALQEHVRRVKDLMAVADFDQAEQTAEEFAQLHPDCQRADELLERTRREAQAYREQMRTKMYKEVQQQAKARQWRAALTAAHKLIEAFPATSEAESVSLQMATMEENAHLEEARELRDEIRDMLGRRRYAEAVAVAEDLMRRFPETQAAADLRSQMDRLRELAAGGT